MWMWFLQKFDVPYDDLKKYMDEWNEYIIKCFMFGCDEHFIPTIFKEKRCEEALDKSKPQMFTKNPTN